MGLFDGIGTNFADEVVPRILADMGVLPVHELVRRVHEGDASEWHEAASKADAIVNAHHEASDRSRRMLQVLESSWTGAGADAAANKIRMGAQAA